MSGTRDPIRHVPFLTVAIPVAEGGKAHESESEARPSVRGVAVVTRIHVDVWRSIAKMLSCSVG
jgi:hypothetical protein